ncbi:MAG: protoporphyrinogen oxidase [Acidobacteria bacterium]|nr:MAG: protoporphyrinogen oxidase [Acidobacteriota bacterium]
MTRQVQALVVGGGISGLVCAYALQKAGVEVLLIEASPRPGGVINSIRRNGYLLELGPQSFSGTAQLRSLCAELGIADQLLEAPPRAPRYVLVDGKLQAVPLSPPAFFTSSLIGPTKWALVRDIFGKSVPPEGDESVAAFIRRKFSKQLLDRLVGPFVSGVYAGDPEKLSLRSAFPMLYEAEKACGSIVRGMFRVAKNKQVPRERPTLNTFREGNETLVRALASKLSSTILTQTRVANLDQQKDGAFLVSLEGGSNDSVSTAFVILATPTNVTGDLLSQLDSRFDSLFAPIEYAAVRLACAFSARCGIRRSFQAVRRKVTLSSRPSLAGLRIPLQQS